MWYQLVQLWDRWMTDKQTWQIGQILLPQSLRREVQSFLCFTFEDNCKFLHWNVIFWSFQFADGIRIFAVFITVFVLVTVQGDKNACFFLGWILCYWFHTSPQSTICTPKSCSELKSFYEVKYKFFTRNILSRATSHRAPRFQWHLDTKMEGLIWVVFPQCKWSLRTVQPVAIP